MSHKCEHGKDSDVCVRCHEESHPAQETAKPVGRPLTDSVAASGHIHIRTTLARKGWYVRTARLHNQTLAEWMQQECDKSSAYPPDNRYERYLPSGDTRQWE